MSKKYEVTAITGKYQDRDGNEKSRYLNIGAVIETRNGPMLKLEAVPVGWDGWAYLNEPKERDQQQQAPGRQAAPAPRQQSRAPAPAPRGGGGGGGGGGGFDDMDDDIPYIDPLKHRGFHLAI